MSRIYNVSYIILEAEMPRVTHTFTDTHIQHCLVNMADDFYMAHYQL